MAASQCTATDLRRVADEMTACPPDAFGSGCSHSYSRSREYVPSRLPSAALLRRYSCARAWLSSWLCQLRAAPHDARDITVGKTILQRLIWTMAATVYKSDGSTSACRPTFDLSALARWRWQLVANASCPSVDAWMLPDACRAVSSNSADADDAAAASFLAAGEEVLRRPIMKQMSTVTGWLSTSAAVWWAGQLARHAAVDSAGTCTRRQAESLPLVSIPATVAASDTWVSTPSFALPSPSTAAPLTVAVHIRRGDACMRWATRQGDSSLKAKAGGRPCYPSAVYANATRRLVDAYGLGREVRVCVCTSQCAAAQAALLSSVHLAID